MGAAREPAQPGRHAVSSLLLLFLAATPSVTLSVSECPDSMKQAIRDELEAAGMSTQLDEGEAQVAHVTVQCEVTRVIARIDDRVTSKSVERQLELTPGARGDVLLALRVVELLHASLAETRYAAIAQVPAPVEQFLAKREPPPPPSRWEFVITGGFTYAPGGFEMQPSVSGEFTRSVKTWSSWQLELGGMLSATVRASKLRSEAGAADMGLVEPRGQVALAWESSGWSLRGCFSLGMLLVWAVGREATGIWGAKAGATTTLATGLGFSATRTLADWLSLRAGVDVAVTPFPVRVTIPETTASIGLPIVTLQLGLVFR